ncbi:cell division-associated protein bimb [Arthroderma uncinatum]|uniref:cell division-associated protein bimb n=1 Tax=Arthroderma uncinatum TaxID=74035 RepID=UPI00144A56F7|nr:cell division-associated protein bimb [Arthroderma uncinatum]KAF3484017.1 cell division-associated protein bimb [Arthroderma uncinatum]
MGGLLLDSLADSVKQGLQHPSKCSNTTVATLRQLLTSATNDAKPKETKSTKRVTANPTSSKPSRTVKIRAAAKASVPTQSTGEADAPLLSKHEKLVLATEVFNIASKLLSEHIKKVPASRATKAPRANGNHGGRNDGGAKTPLQLTSPNPKIQPLDNVKDGSDELVKADGKTRINVVAECALLSLETLRDIRVSEESFDPNNLHLSQGIAILVGKLLVVGLQDLAIKALWMLKSTLLIAIDAERTKRTQGLVKKHMAIQKPSLESLLEFQVLPESGPLLQLLISFQSYALKILTSGGSPVTSRKILQLLTLENPSSPANAILAAHNMGTITDDKAAQQLQSHSQNILSLSIILSPAEEKQTPSDSRVNPTVPLLLQFLALEIRCIWWKISGHNCDQDKELWGPLSRYVTTYARRCPNSQKHEFDGIQAAFGKLKARLKSNGYIEQNSEHKSNFMAVVAKTLGQIAYSAGRLEIATELCESSATSLPNGRPVQRAIFQCRRALLKVESLKPRSTPDTQALNAIGEAATDLASSMKGNQTELDELLMESALLKKAVMKHISSTEPSSKDDLGDSSVTKIYDSTLSYLVSFVRFLVRYLTPAVQDAQHDDVDALSLCLQKCGNIALAAVDSGVALGKLSSGGTSLLWSKVEPVLPACVSLCQLLRKIGSRCEPDNGAALNSSLRLLRISNLYWSTYMRYKDLGKEPLELLPPVEQAINVLKHCALPEQISGLISIKLERQAALYSEIGKAKRSSAAYISAIQAHLEAGVLETASRMASEGHPRHIWKDPRGPAYALGRVMGSYIRSQIKHEPRLNSVIYDSEGLQPCHRATLLEQQAAILMDTPQVATSPATIAHLSSLISTILSLLTWGTYPIRRSRVIHQILRFLLEHNPPFEKSFSESLLTEAARCLSSIVTPSEDKDLMLLRDDLEASLMITMGFCSGTPSTEVLENAVQTWVVILQGCGSWESVQARIGDPLALVAQLRGLVDYLEVRGLWKLKITALAAISRLLTLQERADFSTTVACYSSMGLQYSRLGYSDKAGHMLTKAKAISEEHTITPHVLLSWHLGFAEYQLEIGDPAKSIESILRAQPIFDGISASLSKENFQTRATIERLAADASTLLSRSFLAKGEPNEAAYYAKRAVKISSRLWARLEKYIETKLEKHSQDKSSISPDALADGIAALEISAKNRKPSNSHFEGSVYWPHFSSHVAALLQLSRISDHNGFFQEAVYHGEQALAACDAIGAHSLAALVKAELGDRFIRGGRTHKGAELLEKLHNESQVSLDSILPISLNMHLVSLYVLREEMESAYRILSESIQALMSLTNTNTVDLLDPFFDPLKEIVKQTKDLSITSAEKPCTTTATRALRSRSVKKPRQTKPPPVRPKTPAPIEVDTPHNRPLIARLHSNLLRKQAMLLLPSQKFNEVLTLLNQADRVLSTETTDSTHSLCKVHYTLGVAVQKLAGHSVYCVLPESTISLPSLHCAGQVLKETASRSKSRAGTRRLKSASTTETSAKPLSHGEGDISETLSTAKQVLADISSSVSLRGSSKEGHEISYLRSRTSMLAFATGSARSSEVEPFIAAHAIELGRNSAFSRDHLAIVSDKELSGHMSGLDWPASPSANLALPPVEESHFIENYVNSLPAEWDIISITLCPSQDEFIISKLRSGQSPLILRLPLKRGGEDDMDEETFSFQEGKAELLEIIRLANASAHNTGACVGKKAKKEWWANRENLDQQLKDLLQNIETVWFGGFRGIFSQAPRNEALLAKFTSSFNKILDKHLPSRREKRGKAKVNYPTFDPWVMELFVNIGSLDDEMNPEDAVMDFLYFIVDILQFHGETNAYDEIDFDMMVVETLDALHCYAEEDRRERTSTHSRHTILILDKSLHAFPWESMGCLQNSSVSRMPSLQSVREQVLRFQGQEIPENGQFGFYANRNNGTYILNPGGDLKSTETAFGAPLSALQGWTGRVHTAPTEEAFETALKSKDIMLYFGHGSGAQYIRGRTVRRLDRCAVTFLMGCSSGSMTEAGDFEPYGTPWNYMHAGAPALVATLWDVTDKDIDRFAKTVFEKWGLLSASASTANSSTSPSQGENQADQIGLDTAVAGSRDSCILKYLNGAAPVIYGVPVFLK